MFQTFDTPPGGDAGAARLAALREELARRGLDGFVVPRADAHQGEYVAPRDERLAWLTGFTGSAGSAIALTARAAVFVDGRYTLQAADQVDGEVFEITPVAKVKPAGWLAEAAPKGARIGYDPWLHGRDEIDRLSKALADKGGQMLATEGNPVDAVWPDQPGPPRAPLRVHADDLAGRGSADKRAEMGREIAAAGAAATVLTLADSIAWTFNVRGADIPRNPVPLVFAILHADGRATIFAEAGQINGEVAAHLGAEVTRRDPAEIGSALDGLAGKAVALDPASCPLAVAHRLESAGASIIWRPDPAIALKARKTEAELTGARAAHRRDGAALARFLRWFDEAETPTEIEVVERLEAERRATNVLLDISFDTIAGAGPNGAIVHYRVNEASNRRLAKGDLMLVDSGGQYEDGTTDVTRTIWTGPPPEGAARAYTLVLKGMIALSEARFPEGTTGRDLDILARGPLWRAGLDYDHGTGHGVGAALCVHEGPARIARAGEVEIAPGMILSNEPGYYREGAFGIRIENLLAVTEPATPEGGEREMMGFETLTLAPIDTRLIDRALMTAAEVAWLNAYHARVQAEIGPQLSGADAAWLKAACAPLT